MVLGVQIFRSRRAAAAGSQDADRLGVVHPDPLAPLSRDRVVAWLRSEKVHFFVDDEGDVGGLWDSSLLYFFVHGEHDEVLLVRSMWHREVSIERFEEVLELCNAWNAEKVWPKAYLRVRDNGKVLVHADITYDLEPGVSDTQLGWLLHSAIGTHLAFLSELERHYPDPVGEAP